MDGTPTLRMNEFVLASLASNRVDLGPARTTSTGSDLPAPEELKFVLNATVRSAVESSCERFNKLVGHHDLHVRSTLFSALEFYLNLNLSNCQVLHYEGYGKNYIKKFKASPDAWVQLVKQLAYHKMFHRPGVTYESAQTRKYQLGRTEVIRSASNETKAWAEAMSDPDQTVSVSYAQQF